MLDSLQVYHGLPVFRAYESVLRRMIVSRFEELQPAYSRIDKDNVIHQNCHLWFMSWRFRYDITPFLELLLIFYSSSLSMKISEFLVVQLQYSLIDQTKWILFYSSASILHGVENPWKRFLVELTRLSSTDPAFAYAVIRTVISEYSDISW